MTIYIDYAAGRFEAWHNSEGFKKYIGHEINIPEMKAKASRHVGYPAKEIKFVLTQEAKSH